MKRKLLTLATLAVGSWSFGQYCAGGPTSASYSDVQSVDLIGDNQTISYTHSCPGVIGLNDQTAMLADVTAGNQYQIDVVFGSCNGYYTGAGTVWIDWNGDQTFDATEVIGTFSGGTPFTGNFSFTVPATAVNGLQRIRIKHQEFGSLPQSSCGSFTWGSLVDFGIVVTGGTGCGSPYGLGVTGGTQSQVDLGWSTFSTPTGGYIVEYGPAGFTPGTGTSNPVTATTTDQVSGLTINSFYDFYVRSICGPGDTSLYHGPVSANTYGVGAYMDWDNSCPNIGYIEVDTVPGAQFETVGDIQSFGITLPFSLLYQNTLVNDISVGDEGAIMFNSLTGYITYNNTTLTQSNFDGIYPFWDDLHTGDIYYATVGTAPNRIFVIEWDDRPHFVTVAGQTVDFQVQIHEADQSIYFVYNDKVFGGTQAQYDYAGNATIGIKGPSQILQVSYNDMNYLQNNSCAHFFYTDCPNVSNLVVTTYDYNQIGLDWSAGLAQETEWIVEWGTPGFTPGGAGSLGTQTTTNSSDTITGLTQLTDYDVYVYASCDPATSLTSSGMLVQHQTAPECANPFGIGTGAAPDSIFASWNWQPNSSGALAASFNITYVPSGQDVYGSSATEVNTGNSIFSDSIVDSTLIASGVYDLYVQTLCSNGDTSLYIGPINFLAFLDNDSSCYAQELQVNGNPYILYNNGAQNDPGLQAIAPPANGSQVDNGWANSTIYNSTWYTFTAPASGDLIISGTDLNTGTKMAVYETTNCGDYNQFNFVSGNDNGYLFGYTQAAQWVVCGLTPGQTYYLLHSNDYSWSGPGTYTISLTELDFNAGTSNGIVDACLGDTVDLFTGISGYDLQYGNWIDLPNTSQIVNGSDFATSVLASQVYDFEYRVQLGCSFDSIVAQVEIYPPSSAGNNGQIDVCKNEPINLYYGLSGNVDLGGTWYDPQDNVVNSDIPSSGNVPGQFNYDYVAGNGVCPDDTALVLVVVDATCDWMNVEEVQIGGITVFPNPTSENLNIVSNGEHEDLSIVLVDMNGRVVYTSEKALVSGNQVTLEIANLTTGVYMLKLTNETATNSYRIVVE